MSKYMTLWTIAFVVTGCALDGEPPEGEVAAAAAPVVVACGGSTQYTSTSNGVGTSTSRESAISTAEYNALRGCNGYHWFALESYNSCTNAACPLSGTRSCAITSPGTITRTYSGLYGQLNYEAKAVATLTTVVRCGGLPSPGATPPPPPSR